MQQRPQILNSRQNNTERQIMNIIAQHLFPPLPIPNISDFQEIDIILNSSSPNLPVNNGPVRGLPNNLITNIPVNLTSKLKRKEEICAICRDNFINDPFNKQLHCGHFFHPNCIGEWLSQNSQCPTCRATIR